MIWFRRSLAIFLIVLFFPVFLVTLTVLGVNDTFLSADFYIDQLRKADIFNFMYDEVVPAALDEVSQDSSQDIPVDLEVVQDELVTSVREVLPPEWLQGQVEMVIGEVLPYLTGDTDSFSVTLSVSERLVTLGEVVKRELGGGDTYNLLFDEVLAPALDEQLQDIGDLPFGITIASQDIVDAVQEVLPPQWIRARVEHLVDQLVPYLTGGSEHFAIHMPLADRLEALAPVLKELLVRSNVYNVLSNQEFADTVDEQLEDFGELPFGVKVTNNQLVSALQTVAPPPWIQTQVERVLDEMVPYVTGKQDGFEVVVPLKDRVEAAVLVVKQLLRDVKAYDLLFDEVIVNMVEENIGDLAQLPFGIAITAEEIEPALRKVLPPSFIQEQAEKMIDEVVPFFTGEAEGFRIVVPLAGRKDAALLVIEEMADQKLQELIDSLPRCSLDEAMDLALGGFSGQVPPCHPTGYSLEEIKAALGFDIPGITIGDIEKQLGIDLTLVTEGVTMENLEESLGIDVLEQVIRIIGDSLPDEFVYTDADLRTTLSDEHEETLDDALNWIRNGFPYTDADLREDLMGEGGDTSKVETLDDVLEWGRQGLTYTDADLRKDLMGEGGDTSNIETLDDVLEWAREGFTFTEADLREAVVEGEDVQSFDAFDRGRKILGQARDFSFLAYLVPLVFLAAIGFLGGRKWLSRLAWAVVALLIAAGITYAVFGPVYHIVAEPLIDDELAQVVSGATGIERLMSDKGIAVGKGVVDTLLSGLESRALLLLIVAAVALGVAILWPTMSRFLGRGRKELA